ncbi:hypothetical protein [Embleya sp. NPDC005575]
MTDFPTATTEAEFQAIDRPRPQSTAIPGSVTDLDELAEHRFGIR